LLTHLTSSDWSEVLEEEALPFKERLAIALQFLDDNGLSSYLRRTKESCSTRGDIEGIIITGLTPMGMDILQSYVDRTGDVQTAAILSSFMSSSGLVGPRAKRWLDAYRNLLDGLRLFHHRVNFDVERGRLLQEDRGQEGWGGSESANVQRQILIRCSYCNKDLRTMVNSIGPRLEAKVGVALQIFAFTHHPLLLAHHVPSLRSITPTVFGMLVDS
jgi:WD repeat-containing protein mio